MSNKTVSTNDSVDAFIASLDDSQQIRDSEALLGLFRDVTGEQPVMWGSSIIGFGSVHLTYASGRKVDWLKAGFSPRKGKLSLYVTFDAATLTAQFPKLGTYKIAKGCIYIRRLGDVDLNELRRLIDYAVKQGHQQPGRDNGKEQVVSWE